MSGDQARSDIALPWWSRNPLMIWRVWQYRGWVKSTWRGSVVALVVMPDGKDTMLIRRPPTRDDPVWLLESVYYATGVERVPSWRIRHWSTDRFEAGYSF